jgi:hypothetical protein
MRQTRIVAGVTPKRPSGRNLTLIFSTCLYFSRPDIQCRSNPAMNLVIGVVAGGSKIKSRSD